MVRVVIIGNNFTINSNFIQIYQMGSSLKCLLPLSLSQAQLVNTGFSEPELHSAQKFKNCLRPSQADLGV